MFETLSEFYQILPEAFLWKLKSYRRNQEETEYRGGNE
jgi:hypothetical protein